MSTTELELTVRTALRSFRVSIDPRHRRGGLKYLAGSQNLQICTSREQATYYTDVVMREHSPLEKLGAPGIEPRDWCGRRNWRSR